MLITARRVIFGSWLNLLLVFIPIVLVLDWMPAGDVLIFIGIAKDASVQIALLVAPVLVIYSFLSGKPMNLVFHTFELFGMGLAVLAVTFASLDGESNWYEGVLLMALYVIVGVTTFFVPA